MKRALSVTWFAMRALYDELFLMGGMGFIWFLVAIALPYGAFYVTSLTEIGGLTIAAVGIALIPLPPITGALYAVAIHVAREERIEFSYFWEGLRSHFVQSWKIGAFVLITAGILIVDVVFYLSAESLLFRILGFLGLWALLFWAAIQIYLFPLSFVQEDTRLRIMLKNASLLTLAFPVFGLVILIVTLLATALSVLLLLFMLATIWMPFFAILNCRATITSVQEVQAIRQRQAEIERELREDEE